MAPGESSVYCCPPEPGISPVAEARLSLRELGGVVAPPSRALHTAHWLEPASALLDPALSQTLPSHPHHHPHPHPQAQSVVRGDGACAQGFGRGPLQLAGYQVLCCLDPLCSVK